MFWPASAYCHVVACTIPVPLFLLLSFVVVVLVVVGAAESGSLHVSCCDTVLPMSQFSWLLFSTAMLLENPCNDSAGVARDPVVQDIALPGSRNSNGSSSPLPCG